MKNKKYKVPLLLISAFGGQQWKKHGPWPEFTAQVFTYLLASVTRWGGYNNISDGGERHDRDRVSGKLSWELATAALNLSLTLPQSKFNIQQWHIND